MPADLVMNKVSALEEIIPLLCSPSSHVQLKLVDGTLTDIEHNTHFEINSESIPIFANELSGDAQIQQQHYDQIADAYANNLDYPHTKEYLQYLDGVLSDEVGEQSLGICAEICCGTGEAFDLYQSQIETGIGIDISTAMLSYAQKKHPKHLHFIQGDATALPLQSNSFDTVFILGGIHHVPERIALFKEVFRVLKPGGKFIYREPVSDFWLWKFLRAIIYRISPILDHDTEAPLLFAETVPLLDDAGFERGEWKTCGFLGFCVFMNSDVLFFNRLFRFIPGIRAITRWSAKFDSWCLTFNSLKRSGLQVVGSAVKPITNPK
ncbi:MAG: methyltransferase type 11 [Kangiella sp.]|nr:MAG: methyltransferase type 11 [Kangiella sp.]